MHLSDVLREERIRREEAESESNQVKEEARFLREDLTRAKTSYMSKVEEKELELKQLCHDEGEPRGWRDAFLVSSTHLNICH